MKLQYITESLRQKATVRILFFIDLIGPESAAMVKSWLFVVPGLYRVYDTAQDFSAMKKNVQIAFLAVLIYIAGIFSAVLYNNNNKTNANLLDSKKTVMVETFPVIHDFPLPESVSLCGETIPLEIHWVWEMLDREFNITVWDRAQVFMYLKRAGRYFPYIEKKLHDEGMPDDLKYLAVAESALLTYSRSKKGAKGPWQFMTLAARSNGLRRDRVVDERLHFERATDAALNNLKRLEKKFGSWALAMAAYNGGETRLRKAIKEQKTTDYYRLNLPLETERYIFRIAAIKTILENPKRYGYHLSTERAYEPRAFDTVEATFKAPVDIVLIAESIGTDFKMIKELNPQFLKDFIPAGRHFLKAPPGTGANLTAFLKQIPAKVSMPVFIVSSRIEVETH